MRTPAELAALLREAAAECDEGAAFARECFDADDEARLQALAQRLRDAADEVGP